MMIFEAYEGCTFTVSWYGLRHPYYFHVFNEIDRLIHSGTSHSLHGAKYEAHSFICYRT